jgi:hypothetical protein
MGGKNHNQKPVRAKSLTAFLLLTIKPIYRRDK